MRHGMSADGLMRLAHKIASDGCRLRGATLGDRFDDLVSRLVRAGLEAALRYDPAHEQRSYGRNGGDPFTSYISDVMAKRIDDHFRSKGEGFGDRRYGHDNRQVLVDEFDPAERELHFDELVDERRRSRWQEAARATGWSLEDWIVITLDKGARGVLRRAV